MKLSDIDPLQATETLILFKTINMIMYLSMIGISYRKHPLKNFDQRYQIQSRLNSHFPILYNYGIKVQIASSIIHIFLHCVKN